MKNIIKKFFDFIKTGITLPIKDPNDFTKTSSSSNWYTEQYCKLCKHPVGHNEKMSGICNSCGGFSNLLYAPYRSYRGIWNGKEWLFQYKYGNEIKDYEIVKNRYE